MPPDHQRVGHRLDRIRDQLDQLARVRLQRGGAEREHRIVRVVDQVDPHPVIGHREVDVLAQPGEFARRGDARLHLPLQRVEVAAVLRRQRLARLERALRARSRGRSARRADRNGERARPRLRRLVREVVRVDDRLAAEQPLPADARVLGVDQCRREVIGDALALLLRGRAEQPQEQEERHHRGDEIGVRDLPCAAMMAAMAFDVDLLVDDPRWLIRAVRRAGGHQAAIKEKKNVSRKDAKTQREGIRTSNRVSGLSILVDRYELRASARDPAPRLRARRHFFFASLRLCVRQFFASSASITCPSAHRTPRQTRAGSRGRCRSARLRSPAAAGGRGARR